MKTLLIQVLFLLCCSFSLNATVIVWNGGAGDWDDPTQWSTGTVPNILDTVIIENSGLVTIPSSAFASARLLTVYDTLIIETNASLNFSNAVSTGLINEGVVRNRGTITVTGATSFGIENYAKLINYASGSIIMNSCYGGIAVRTTGLFKNFGGVLINDNTGTSALSSFECEGEFINKANGSIDIFGGRSIRVLHVAIFTNLGLINVTNTNSTGFSNFSDNCVNANGGILNISGSSIDGLYSVGVFKNRGTINISDTDEQQLQIYNSQFQNGKTGQIIISGAADNGIRVHLATFQNNGLLQISGSYNIAAMELLTGIVDNGSDIELNSSDSLTLDLNSLVINQACASFQVDGDFRNDNIIDNDGWLRLSSSNSPISNIILNNGVIEDLNGSLDLITVSGGIRIAPLNVTGEEGLAIPDALDFTSLGSFDIYNDKWYTDVSLTTEAGDYDESLNEFTPLAAAVGLNTFFMGIRDINNSCNAIFQIDITGGVIAAGPVRPPSNPNLGVIAVDFQTPESITLFPNPAKESFSIQSSTPFGEGLVLSIYDLQGRRLLSRSINEEGATSIEVELGNSFLPGLYLLRLEGGNHLTLSRRLVLE